MDGVPKKRLCILQSRICSVEKLLAGVLTIALICLSIVDENVRLHLCHLKHNLVLLASFLTAKNHKQDLQAACFFSQR